MEIKKNMTNSEKMELAEYRTIKNLITNVYPVGVISIVSDSFDFWSVITKIAPALKDEIMSRQPNSIGLNKVVFRPDSGDPVDIICGTGGTDTPESKGAVECLWDVFGGTINDEGYKTLDQHVGLIYGDSITLERAEAILKGLKKKGFASDNIVFGIGSYTYQHITRDTFGFAMKATWGQVNGEGRDIFKDPKTGDGTKKSATGILRVEKEGFGFVLYQQQTPIEEGGELHVVFNDGLVYNTQSIDDIRDVIGEAL